MIDLEACIAMCGLEHEEVAAICEHEHICEAEAAALASYLLHQAHGALRRRIDPSTQAEWVYALQCNLPVKTTETVLIIDQFEELLTQTPQAKRQPFLDWLMDITSSSAAIPVRVLLTIRADYFNLCSPYAAFYERIKPDAHALDGAQEPARPSPHFRLKALMTEVDRSGATAPGSNSYSGLAAIVHRPLILAGHSDETERNALVAAIRRDVSDRPGDLALVQMALYETWRKSKAGRANLITAYSEVGGVAGALAHAAEEVRTKKLTSDEAGRLEAVLVRLVNLGDTGGLRDESLGTMNSIRRGAPWRKNSRPKNSAGCCLPAPTRLKFAMSNSSRSGRGGRTA